MRGQVHCVEVSL